jgi:hypothetical protein
MPARSRGIHARGDAMPKVIAIIAAIAAASKDRQPGIRHR